MTLTALTPTFRDLLLGSSVQDAMMGQTHT